MKILKLSLDEVKVIAEIRDMKGYKSMSEERLLSSLNESKSLKKSEKKFGNGRIEKIKKDFNEFRNRLFKPKITKYQKRALYNRKQSSGYSLFTNCSFDLTKSKLYCYRGKDCIKRFYKDLKEHATQIINYEKERNDTIN